MIAPEVLGRMGLIPAQTALPWFKSVSWCKSNGSGYAMLQCTAMLLVDYAHHGRGSQFKGGSHCALVLGWVTWQQSMLPLLVQGVFPPAGDYNYWADSYTLFGLELVLMAFAEHKR